MGWSGGVRISWGARGEGSVGAGRPRKRKQLFQVMSSTRSTFLRLPPKSSFSSSRVRCPARLRWRPAVSPAGPPPTITTS